MCVSNISIKLIQKTFLFNLRPIELPISNTIFYFILFYFGVIMEFQEYGLKNDMEVFIVQKIQGDRG